MKTSTEDQVTLDRNRLIVVAIGLIVLAIFSSVAFRFPEASTPIVGFLRIGNIIEMVISVIMLSMILSIRDRLTRFITYYAHSIFKVRQSPSRAKVADKIGGLSAELSNVVVIAIAWPLVRQIVIRLLMIDPKLGLDWITILVTLAFVGLLLYRLYRGYRLLEPVLAVVGKSSQEAPCPACGTPNLVTAKFCSSCGGELRSASAKVATLTAPLHCPKCGAENSPGVKFCNNCGESLQKPE